MTHGVCRALARAGRAGATLLVGALLGGHMGSGRRITLTEHRAEVVTYDRDLDRFPGVRSERPLRGTSS